MSVNIKIAFSKAVQFAKYREPGILAGIPDQKAEKLLQRAFAQLGDYLDSIDEGVVTVEGLGRFRIRRIERTKAGESKDVKLIVFRCVSPEASRIDKL